jgi:hypothetical protein
LDKSFVRGEVVQINKLGSPTPSARVFRTKTQFISGAHRLIPKATIFKAGNLCKKPDVYIAFWLFCLVHKKPNRRIIFNNNHCNMSNDTLNSYFRPIFKAGHWKLTKLPIIASVAMYAGAALYDVQDGTNTIATASTQNFSGILLEAIVSTDADYATSAKLKACAVPLLPAAEAEFEVGAGTLTQADEGKCVKFNDAYGLAVDTAGTDGAAHAIITKYLSATRGKCKFLLDFGSIDVA